MSVGDEHQINVGEMVMSQSGVTKSSYDQQPVGPIWIDEDIAVWTLNQKGGVPDPGDGNLSLPQFRKNGGSVGSVAPLAGKKSRKKNVGDEAVGSRTFSGMGETRAQASENDGKPRGGQSSRRSWPKGLIQAFSDL